MSNVHDFNYVEPLEKSCCFFANFMTGTEGNTIVETFSVQLEQLLAFSLAFICFNRSRFFIFFGNPIDDSSDKTIEAWDFFIKHTVVQFSVLFQPTFVCQLVLSNNSHFQNKRVVNIKVVVVGIFVRHVGNNVRDHTLNRILKFVGEFPIGVGTFFMCGFSCFVFLEKIQIDICGSI